MARTVLLAGLFAGLLSGAAGAGDVNKDGYADVIAGAHGFSTTNGVNIDIH
ncbi:MAG: FG-GAP repeat protein [Planctomycetes bacterium]|nr:FG-GAP repeat protein [Planctomycetota bacterium]